MTGCFRVPSRWSATIPLPDYGRVVRQPEAIAIVFDSCQRRELFPTNCLWLRTTECLASTELTISHELYFLEY